jgi:phosphatidylinositol-3-phosphatase
MISALAVALLAACGSASSSPQSQPPHSRGTTASPTHRPAHRHSPALSRSHARHARHARSTPSSGSSVTGATKLLVFVVENHSLAEMRSQMPWTFALAQRYGYATDFHAMTHPSLPNYLAIAGGSTFGVTDDNDPSSHPLPGASVFGEALHAGLTAHVYAESMPAPCTTYPAGEYAVKHNPWTYLVDERSLCRAHDTSMSSFAGDVRAGHLPDAGMVVPNICNDAHDCSLGTADAWLRREVGLAMSGPDFTSGRLAIVITADEDDGSQGNTVLTILVHPSVRGVVTGAPLSHLSLSRLYSQVLGLPPLRAAASAPSMVTPFGLAIGSR